MLPMKRGEKKVSPIPASLIIAVAVILTACFCIYGLLENSEILQRTAIAKEMCENLTFVFVKYDAGSVFCKSNITYKYEHFNLTPQQLDLTIKPDWDYYLKKGATK